MKYKNIKTGFIFDSKTEIKGEDWVVLSPQPSEKKEKEEKPKRAKRDK